MSLNEKKDDEHLPVLPNRLSLKINFHWNSTTQW